MQERLPVTDETFIKNLKQKVAKACFRRFKWLNPDDAFQDVYLHFLERPESRQTVDFAIIDILRSKHGRKGAPNYEARQSLEFAGNFEDLTKKRAPDVFGQLEAKIEVERRFKQLDEREKEIVEKWFYEGRRGADIAKDYELTESRVQQIKETALDKMRGLKVDEVKAIEARPDGFIKVLEAAKKLGVSYVTLSKGCQTGQIPFELFKEGFRQPVRHLAPDTYQTLVRLVEDHGANFYKFVPFVVSKPIQNAPPIAQKPPKVDLKASAPPVDGLRAKLNAKAKALKDAGKFEAAAEFYQFALDLA